jgi:hypothetical protein
MKWYKHVQIVNKHAPIDYSIDNTTTASSLYAFNLDNGQKVAKKINNL